MAQRRSRFGYFLGCDRYPECKFIPKPEVPEEFRLAFEAACPSCGDEHKGKLRPRRNTKRNTYFYSCDRYPECKTIRPRPTGAVHGGCGAVIGKDDEGGICTRCGARVDIPDGELLGLVIDGGTPDPLAFAPKRGRRAAAGGAKAEGNKAKAEGNKAKAASRDRASKSKGKPKRVPVGVAVADAPAESAGGAPSLEDEAT